MSYYELYYGKILNIYIYNRGSDKITVDAEKVVLENGCEIANDLNCDIAIAPCLNEILTRGKINAPKYGTLIFHPSLLPFYRGSDAIKYQFKNGEKNGGATWFWGSPAMDGGDICEQEPTLITGTPRVYYDEIIIPLALKMLNNIIYDIKNNVIRKRPQNHSIASFTYKNNSAAHYNGA